MHIVGVSSLAAGHLTLVPDSRLRSRTSGEATSSSLSAASFRGGLSGTLRGRRQAVFGPGTNIAAAAAGLIAKLNSELGYSGTEAADRAKPHSCSVKS